MARLRKHLDEADPDLLRAMVKAFATRSWAPRPAVDERAAGDHTAVPDVVREAPRRYLTERGV